MSRRRPPDTRTRRPPRVERPGDDDSSLVPTPDEPGPDEITFESVSSVLGSVERAGDWLVADRTQARAILGELKLDFSRADLPSDGVIAIRCNVVCGQLEIVVPEGSEIEMNGVRAFVSEVKHVGARVKLREVLRRAIVGAEPEPRARDAGELPLFIVTGQVVFGGLSIITR